MAPPMCLESGFSTKRTWPDVRLESAFGGRAEVEFRGRQVPDDGGKDMFVHITAVERAGLDYLREGDKVTYDVVDSRGKPVAGNLRLK
jgi:cold shock protein